MSVYQKLWAACGIALTVAWCSAIAGDGSALPVYKPGPPLAGELHVAGSTTLKPLFEAWGEKLAEAHPDLKLFHEGQGSATGPPALQRGECDIAAMSRLPTTAEISRFAWVTGHTPVTSIMGWDNIAVLVHPDNPVAADGLSLRDLAKLFGASNEEEGLRQGERWREVGVEGKLGAEAVNFYNRPRSSATQLVVREVVLNGGDYRPDAMTRQTAQAVVEAVANDPAGIGFAGLGCKTEGVSVVPIKVDGRHTKVATAGRADMSYPLIRPFVILGDWPEGTPKERKHRELLELIFSCDGQHLMAQVGFVPLTEDSVLKIRKRLGLDD